MFISQWLRPTVKNLLLVIGVLGISASLFAACGNSVDPLVGTWEAASTSGTRTDGTLFNRRSAVEFLEDGTLILEGSSAKWSWPAKDTLQIEFPEAAYVVEARLVKKELVVRDTGFGGDAVVTFTRNPSRRLSLDQ